MSVETSKAPPPDPALFETALRHQRAGEIAQAIACYHRILSAKPDFFEAHANLGSALIAARKFDEAAASCHAALAIAPNSAEAHNNLGNALQHQGKHAAAILSFMQATAIKPGYADAHYNLGNSLLARGETEKAIESYMRTLDARPDHSQALNNLGRALASMGRLDVAEASFRRSIEHNSDDAEAHCNLGAMLAARHEFAGAAASYQRAIGLRPEMFQAYNNLGNAFTELDKFREAEAAFDTALALKPDFSEARYNLASALLRSGRVEQSFATFTRHAELTYGDGGVQDNDPAIPHKLKHDREQRAYLSKGATGTTGSGLAFHLADVGRIVGPAVNPATMVDDIQRQWRQNRPQIVTIDNILTDEALEGLRQFCWGSTIWRQVYSGGYLGAMPEHGFACPLLAQIAEELPRAYPAIFGTHSLTQLWAFKYDSELGGIKIHADFAAVNVNFWLTPDESNLDPASGGLVIWDAAAPLDWDFHKYNNAESDIRTFLAHGGAKSVAIPYRANRAVIFDSDLFHETDRIAFKSGYLDHRINVTFLYGKRETRVRP